MAVIIEEITATVIPPEAPGQQQQTHSVEASAGAAGDVRRIAEALDRMRERQCRVRAD